MASEATLTKLCFTIQTRTVYDCSAVPPTELIEVLVFNSEGQLIPHNSTVFTDPTGATFGDGSGFIRSHFTNLNGEAILQANRPLNWSGDKCNCCQPVPNYVSIQNGATWTPPPNTTSVTIQNITGTNSLQTAVGTANMSEGTTKSWEAIDFSVFEVFTDNLGLAEIHYTVCEPS